MKISLFYDHVTVLDYAYLDDHLGLVGDSLHVNVEFIGSTDNEGVVFDFSYAKKKVKELIDLHCDHRLVVPQGLVKWAQERGELTYCYGQNDSELIYSAPLEAFCEIPSRHINKQTLSTYLEDLIRPQLPENISSLKISLLDEEKIIEREGRPTKACFHYTHGLKDHYGNCQRLFHGHKNTVDVWVNGELRSDLEKLLARDYFLGNIHFCYRDNVVNGEEVDKALAGGHFGIPRELPFVEIKYTSLQGEFYARLPGKSVYILDIESTVENLSTHFAQLVKSLARPGDLVQVRAYEGIAKGAVSTLT